MMEEARVRLSFPRASRVPAWPRWSVAAVVAWLGLVWLIHLVAPGVVLCTLRRHTGLPCPTCGLTRGVTAILRGHVVHGLAYNPLFLVVLVVITALLGARLLLARAPRLELGRRERRMAWALGGLLLLANWAYVIAYVG